MRFKRKMWCVDMEKWKQNKLADKVYRLKRESALLGLIFCISQNSRIKWLDSLRCDMYFEKRLSYTDNSDRTFHWRRGERMDTAQRIKLIRMIEKIEKNPEFSNKIGVRNTSEFILRKQSKKWMTQIITGVRRSRICYRYYLLYAWSGLLENFLYLV